MCPVNGPMSDRRAARQSWSRIACNCSHVKEFMHLDRRLTPPWHSGCDGFGRHAITPKALIAPRTQLGQCASTDAREKLMKLFIRVQSLVRDSLQSLVRDEEGQDLVEYAMLVALIALFCVTAVGLAGTSVAAVFTKITAALPAA
jgi:Flp pilus assembly pilin Flp